MKIQDLKDTTITLKEGRKEKEYILKCKFFSDETGKEYWIYTDETPNEKGEVELKVSSLSIVEGEPVLKSCVKEDELKLVVSMYEALKRRVKVSKEKKDEKKKTKS